MATEFNWDLFINRRKDKGEQTSLSLSHLLPQILSRPQTFFNLSLLASSLLRLDSANPWLIGPCEMLSWAYCNPLIHRCVFSTGVLFLDFCFCLFLVDSSELCRCLFSMLMMMMMSCFVFWWFVLYDNKLLKYLIDQINLITSSFCLCRRVVLMWSLWYVWSVFLFS